MFGAGGGTCSYEEIEDVDVFLLWGSNAREAHPISFHHLLKGLGNGARMFVVDSRYGAEPDRDDQPELPAERIDEEPKIQDDLYIRDCDKWVLCYKCVEACGDDAQHTFAIAVSGRGFDARISTESDVSQPDSACVYCGNCIGVCPTGAIQFTTEFDMRNAGEWRPEDHSVTH